MSFLFAGFLLGHQRRSARCSFCFHLTVDDLPVKRIDFRIVFAVAVEPRKPM